MIKHLNIDNMLDDILSRGQKTLRKQSFSHKHIFMGQLGHKALGLHAIKKNE